MIKLNYHTLCPTWRSGKKLFKTALVLLLFAASVNAQTTYNPVRYWNFNGANPVADAMGIANLNFTMYASQYSIGSGGQVGNYLTLNDQSWLVDGGPMSLSTGLTVEFLMKPGYKFNSTKFISRGDDVFFIRFDYPKITFYTFHISGSGAYIMDEMQVELNGLGRKSYGYYIDGNWHHLVFKMNTASGVKEIWVDGQLPPGFSKTLATGSFPNAGNLNLYLNHNVNYVKYHGSLDEIAIYNTAIPANLIYKHYLGVQQGQTYNFLDNYVSGIPAPSAVTTGIDLDEYPPGHPNYSMSAIDQLKTWPTPRYKSGHTILPNFNWMDPKYMGGLFQPGVTTSQACANSVTIQTELARNFNYYFNVGAGTDLFDTTWVSVANANPSFKLGMNVYRSQLNGNNPSLTSQSKPNDHYLQNSSGQYLDEDGNVTTSYKWWRPTAPTSSYTADGNQILSSLNNLFSRLNRGVDLINDNAEVFPNITETAASKDPVVTAAKNASGLDWPTFLAKKYMENETQSYRNIFMSHPRMANGKFTEFALDGYPQYRYKWSEARKVNTMINGQYYSTPDFFTRFPSNWRYWVSAWHGWQWIVEIRNQEIPLGDKLFSPFVNAGYDTNEENNIRPAQWLGLLKCVSMAGAEFFYPAYFSLTAPFPDSKRWMWQASIPAYVQGIASRYEEFYRNGELMNGDMGNSYINSTGPGYTFWAGDLRKLVVARKHNTIPKYAITGTIQPNSNMKDATENESTATVTIDGNTLTFKVRRQGSTYIYDRTNASAPVFYQLDAWHEKTDPTRWSRDFMFEGELFDNANTQVSIKTQVPTGTPVGNYTNYTSYIAWPDGAGSFTPVEYNFHPRLGNNNQLYLWVRARSRGGVSTSMSVQMDNGTAKTIGCITDVNWQWYRFDACSQQAISYLNLSIAMHNLKITPGNSKLEIDQVLLSTNSSLVLNPAPPACNASSATITASGATSFCQGGSVTLTASSGSSYLWSPGGQTTQSINVTASGSYNVSVTSGGCSAISSNTSVTVSPIPAATISANGPLNLPSGGSVTLTASAGSSYLWMPGGQVSQSITVSAAGSYTVRVTNSGGCSATSAPVVVTVNSTSPTATITASGPVSFCQGGSVTLTANTGTTYLWSNGATTKSINVNASGTFTVTVTTTGVGTATSAPTTVTVYPYPIITVSASGPLNLTTGGSVTLTSSAGSSYLWLPGGQVTQSLTVYAAGTYTVRVTNSQGCSATSSPIVVTMNSTVPQATITASGATSFCPGSSVNLTASNGSTYLWSTGATTKTITATASGSYVVTVTTTGVGSSTSAPFNVTVYPAPAPITISTSGTTALCTGQSVTLSSPAGIAYSWSPGGQNTQSITTSAAGAYTVTTWNGNGCSTTSPIARVTVSNCTGTCAPPYALVHYNIQRNAATLSWSSPNTGQTGFNAKLKNMTTGVVFLTATSPNTTITVTVNEATKYKWWVRGWCGTVNSAYAGFMTFTTPSPREVNSDGSEPVEMYEPDTEGDYPEDSPTEIRLDAAAMQVFPNPASSDATVIYNISKDGVYDLTLLDINGKAIMQDKLDGVAGHNIHEIDVSSLPKGIYMIRITGDDLQETKRLVVQ